MKTSDCQPEWLGSSLHPSCDPEAVHSCGCILIWFLIFLFLLLSVAKNGDVCISILHEPGEDKFGYEKPEERWLPIHTVETIMISVISMLADPNSDSPANVDAAVSDPPPPCFLYLYQEVTSHRVAALPVEGVAGGSQRGVQEEGGSLREEKSRDGV